MTIPPDPPLAAQPSTPSAAPALTDINAAVEAAIRFKLAGTRGAGPRSSQMRSAIATLHEVKHTVGLPLSVEEIAVGDVRQCVRLWRERDGLTASTINMRLSVLTVLGLDCKGLWLPVRLPLKWWLPPDKLVMLLAWLRGPGDKRRMKSPFMHAALMADYVEFIAFTGLRVEEALRLTWRDVRLDLRAGEGGTILNNTEITVPGTKTARAQASLALSLIPALVLQRRHAEATDMGGLVFPISYDQMHDAWGHCRKFLGEGSNRMATLRALRRTAARNLATACRQIF